NEPKVILPCTGDRVFGMAQDNEMAFAFPWGYAHEIIEGLEGTHKGGTRYPITVTMRDTVTTPKSYQDLMRMLAERDAGANKVIREMAYVLAPRLVNWYTPRL
ncbi:MAG: DUF169 domain-containing protein, partial [Terriglobales bacterium]